MQELDWNKKKREAIKASAHLAKQSNTPSRETKLDQVRASILKRSGKRLRSLAKRPVTRSQLKYSSPGPSHQNLDHFVKNSAQQISFHHQISCNLHTLLHTVYEHTLQWQKT